MSRTTVHSNKEDGKNTLSVAGSVIQINEKTNTIDVPQNGQVYKIISNYIEEQGNMEIVAEDATVNENGEMQKKDGTIITTLNPQAVKTLASYKKQRNEKEKKLKAKDKVSPKAEAEIGE